MVIAPVSALLFLCGPPTILFAIVAKIVYAVYLHRFFGTAHIPLEGIKTVPPFFTDFYPPPAVIFETLILWVVTSGQHHFPPGPQGIRSPSMLRYSFQMEATTRLTFPRVECWGVCSVFLATITDQDYLLGAFSVGEKFFHHSPTESCPYIQNHLSAHTFVSFMSKLM